MWLAKVESSTGSKVEVDWQPFALAQVNADKDAELKVWEKPDVIDGTDPVFLAHRSGLAAKRQGKEAFEAFFIALLKARHEEKADLNDPEVMKASAQTAGLDLARFLEDQADPDLLKVIGDSHTKAVEEHGAFGVPTFVAPNGKAAFVKMFIPPEEQASEIYDSLSNMISEFDHVGEIKRPQPPWPHEVIKG
jgi:hypothetical protein